jgi:hypothetical protein
VNGATERDVSLGSGLAVPRADGRFSSSRFADS